jgi:hypothetical protein
MCFSGDVGFLECWLSIEVCNNMILFYECCRYSERDSKNYKTLITKYQ